VPDPHTSPDIIPSKTGISLNAAVSRGIVAAMKKYFGKGPESAKAYLMDDLLFVVMRGGVLTAEDTMIEAGQYDLVRQFRLKFEEEMSDQLVGMVEELTGRKVLTYQSQILFDPVVAVEIFVFDKPIAGEGEQLPAPE
jgi:uncharacterized protein YbcI